MLSCKEASLMVSRSLDTKLSWPNRVGITIHLLLCKACRRYKTQLRVLHQALQLRALPSRFATHKLDSPAKESIKQVLKKTFHSI